MRKLIIYGLIIVLAWSCAEQIITCRRENKYFQTENVLMQKWAYGVAGNPYQYRILANYTTLLLTGPLLGSKITVLHIKTFQTIAIFLLAFWWFGLYSKNPLLELLIFALVYTVIGCRNVFALDTWYDLIFCQLGALAIHYRKYWWIVLLSALGSINREIFLFFNIFFVVYAFYTRDDEPIAIAIISMLVFWVGFCLVRMYMPKQFEYNTGYYGAHYGLEMFKSNLRLSAVTSFVGTLSFFSFFAVRNFFKWDQLRQLGFIIMGGCALITLLAVSNIDETRILIVPFTLFILPGIIDTMTAKRLNHSPIARRIQTR
jgi:hypothetical protein